MRQIIFISDICIQIPKQTKLKIGEIIRRKLNKKINRKIKELKEEIN